MVKTTSRLLCAFFTSLIASGALPAAAEVFLLQGSTTFNARLLVPYQAAIEAAAKHELVVIPNKSSLGLMALFEGRANFAMISTSLESEVALLRKTMPTLPFERLRSFNIARTRIAFAVNPNNPVRSASLSAVRRVLLGEISNWQELGGRDLPIRVVKVRDGGGVQLSVEAELLGGQQIAPSDPITVQIGTQVVKVVEQEPGALGLAQLGVVHERNLPEILTESVIVQQLNLVTLGDPTPAMQAVIDAARRVAIAKLS